MQSISLIAPRLLLLFLFIYINPIFAGNTDNAACSIESHTRSFYDFKSSQFAPIDAYLETRLPALLLKERLLTSISGQREIKATYYDTPEQTLFNSNIELSHTVEKQLPKYIKEREYVIYRNLITPEKIETIKFQVRRYKTKQSQYDKHPLIKFVRRKDRPLLLERLNETPGIFETLTENLEISHTDKVYFITHMGKVISEISLGNFYIDNFGIPVHGNQLSFEFSDDYKSRLTEDERITLTTTLCTLESEIVKSLSLNFKPEKNGYAQYVTLAKNRLPIRDFILLNPLLFNVLQAVFFIILGALLLILFIGRYNKRTSTKQIERGSRHLP